jgi:hypothetical protein
MGVMGDPKHSTSSSSSVGGGIASLSATNNGLFGEYEGDGGSGAMLETACSISVASASRLAM